MTRLTVLALAVTATVVAGCSGTRPTASPGPNFSPNPRHHQLVTAAKLDPCPASTSSSVPDGLPDLTLPCLATGPAVHMSGLVGKPTVINIWGTWCGPCQKETRYLSAVYDELKPRVRFLGVDTEEANPDSALAFAPHVTPPMRYPSVVDDQRKLLIALHGPIGVPSTVFVDASGRVIRQVSSAYSSAAELRADVARYLGVTA